jgi:hypothetical protein
MTVIPSSIIPDIKLTSIEFNAEKQQLKHLTKMIDTHSRVSKFQANQVKETLNDKHEKQRNY